MRTRHLGDLLGELRGAAAGYCTEYSSFGKP